MKSADANAKLRETAAGGFGLKSARVPPSKLHDLFGLPPFSVWNTREGWWQTQRRLWLKLGLESEKGRADELTYHIPVDLENYASNVGMTKIQTSVFDPVLCQIIYQFFAPSGGVIVDPFAGGSVRGLIASFLGYKYWGSELRGEQVDANRAQAEIRKWGPYKPRWVCGDSTHTLAQAPAADFLLSCPPYGNLEVYSDDPADLSNMEYPAFLTGYRAIIAAAVDRLKDDRFACFVVGNFRDKATGTMHNLMGDTVRAFERCGASLYNDIILVNSVGTGAMRTNTSFVRGARKVVKLHQNVLVFVKGDPKTAAKAAAKAGEVVSQE